jgi:hypothetical protein
MNKYCKGCLMHHSAGRKDPSDHLKKYNDWCAKMGVRAEAVIGHCKLHKYREQEGEHWMKKTGALK